MLLLTFQVFKNSIRYTSLNIVIVIIHENWSLYRILNICHYEKCWRSIIKYTYCTK
jgi:hypothetical protein